VTDKPARVLIIAGSDSSGGAGIQADIKTATALGAYAMTAVTAVTVQDTTSVHAIHPIPPAIVRDQILACLRDIGADAIKTGMLGSAEMVETVAATLAANAADIPLVVDPVLASTSGERFLDQQAIGVLNAKLIPLATLSTPNFVEASVLWGSMRDAEVAARLGKNAVLVTGMETGSDLLVDTLVAPDREPVTFQSVRIDTKHTHGTGCTLSTAIACGLAQGLSLGNAVARAHDYVHEAIRTAPCFGRGRGPLNHMHLSKRSD
jgi:hydroxymethylpyrimidine/phosphomethylpyrimidine kinase